MKSSRIKSVFAPSLVLLIAALVLTGPTITGAQTPSADIPAMKLRVATHVGPSGPYAENVKWFFNELTKRSGGKVTFDLFWSQALVKNEDEVSACGAGTIDFGLSSPAWSVDKNPLWMTLNLPANGSDNWALIRAGHEIMNNDPAVRAEFDKLNVVPSYGYSSGLMFFETKKPATTLDDLKAMRIRSFGGAHSTYLKNGGMRPVLMSIAELYEALGRGVVDGAMIVWQFTSSLKYYEVAPHITLLRRSGAVAGATAIINKDRWNKFPQSLRNIITQATLEFNDRYARTLIEDEETIMKKLTTEYGVKVYKMDDKSNTALEAAAKMAQEEWFSKYETKGVPARAVWDRFQTVVKKYEAEVATKGYPWKR